MPTKLEKSKARTQLRRKAKGREIKEALLSHGHVLNDTQRIAVTLHSDEAPMKAIAKIMGVTVGSAKNYVYSARILLGVSRINN